MDAFLTKPLDREQLGRRSTQPDGDTAGGLAYDPES